jgi:hypothetical protein
MRFEFGIMLASLLLVQRIHDQQLCSQTRRVSRWSSCRVVMIPGCLVFGIRNTNLGSGVAVFPAGHLVKVIRCYVSFDQVILLKMLGVL